MTATTEPDELYTLRAQYSLGHFALALEEARSLARRPLSPALKGEREELLQRAHIALQQYDKVGGDVPGT
jgi:coatomer subunit epsilon